jgi:hypothetical protein
MLISYQRPPVKTRSKLSFSKLSIGGIYAIPLLPFYSMLCTSMRLLLRIEHLHIVSSTLHDDPHRFGWVNSPATEEL